LKNIYHLQLQVFRAVGPWMCPAVCTRMPAATAQQVYERPEHEVCATNINTYNDHKHSMQHLLAEGENPS
jgi:hypothetical protein